MRLSTKLTSYFADYDDYHRVKANKFTHYLGIPLIMITLFGLLQKLSIYELQLNLDASTFALLPNPFVINGAMIIFIAALIWYLTLDPKIAVFFSLVMLIAYWLGAQLSIGALWTLFVGGWILQFIGHTLYEKRQPAFFKNIEHLLIGPLWIFCDITRIRSAHPRR